MFVANGAAWVRVTTVFPPDQVAVTAIAGVIVGVRLPGVIASLNVTTMSAVSATPVAPAAGLVNVIWGGTQAVLNDHGFGLEPVTLIRLPPVVFRADTVIVDTAGRLHTKTGLMDELGKIKRVIERQATVDEVLLVLDATTGQNGLRQARVFAEAVDITGIVLTKLDGTAKGGIVVAVQRELGVPVKLVGLGEGLDDLAPFEPATFVDAILG